MSPRDLGQAITVVDGTPYQFRVSYFDTSPDSNDLLRDLPVAYHFEKLKPKDKSKPRGFYVKVTWELLNLNDGLEKGIPTTHQHVVRFAFESFARDDSGKEYIFTTDEHQRMKQQPELTARSLRIAVLKFVYAVNEHWPTENVSVIDLCDNLNATREEIETWANQLVEEGLLKIGKLKPSDRAGFSTRSYRMNAAKRKEIKEELGDFRDEDGKLKVFLSYSHKDKYIAGEIKREFEEYGFEAFVAHDDIELSREWEDRILEELRACHVFIPILTENFRNSPWTDQEAGHALAGSKVIIPLRVSIDPYGFIGRFQGEKLHKERVPYSCRKIIEVLATRSELAGFFTEGSKAVQKLKGSLQES